MMVTKKIFNRNEYFHLAKLGRTTFRSPEMHTIIKVKTGCNSDHFVVGWVLAGFQPECVFLLTGPEPPTHACL